MLANGHGGLEPYAPCWDLVLLREVDPDGASIYVGVGVVYGMSAPGRNNREYSR
jgi:hypothetical protein